MCYKEPCKNDGSCAQGQDPADFSCTCPETWTGRLNLGIQTIILSLSICWDVLILWYLIKSKNLQRKCYSVLWLFVSRTDLWGSSWPVWNTELYQRWNLPEARRICLLLLSNGIRRYVYLLSIFLFLNEKTGTLEFLLREPTIILWYGKHDVFKINWLNSLSCRRSLWESGVTLLRWSLRQGSRNMRVSRGTSQLHLSLRSGLDRTDLLRGNGEQLYSGVRVWEWYSVYGEPWWLHLRVSERVARWSVWD